MSIRCRLFRGGLGVLVGTLLVASTSGESRAADLPGVAPVNVPTVSQLAPPPSPDVADVAGENVAGLASTILDMQIALAREGISCGSIDGVRGPKTVAALRAFQERNGLPLSGAWDEMTRARLVLKSPALTRMTFSEEDKRQLYPLSPTWLGKSEQPALGFETALELVAERVHASPALLQRLNPGIDWSQLTTGTSVIVPSVELNIPPDKAASLHIRLGERSLAARSADGKLIAHFPVSIARNADKRPEGELRVTVLIPNPNYTFDPEVFPESEEGRQLARKLVIPPGPNNPVGVAWIGLDRAGYGIHGTARPESIGKAESHGCFRLANWDAETLLKLAWVGMPVVVDP